MVVPTCLSRLRQEDYKYEVRLGYTVRPFLKKKKNAKRNLVFSRQINDKYIK
jgi:hypothetical protein